MRKKILFCGTPYFAKSSLDALFKLQEDLSYDLVGVVTIKDKIAGRGQKKQESTIKKAAKILNLKIFTPENLEDLNYVAKSLGLNPAEDPRVIHQPDESLSVDLTLILGKDFSSIKSMQAHMDK